MNSNIKTNFTEEEISEYINELNNAKGSERKIKKLLDLNHLPILVAYLKKIGVNEELLGYAAVVEFTRYKMIDVLTSSATKEWKVSDTGVDFEMFDKYSHPERIGVDDANTFWLGKDKFFGRRYREIDGELWPVDHYLYLKRKMYYYKDDDRPINSWGFAFCRFKHCGEFFIMDRIKDDENGVKYFYTTRSDVGMSEYTVRRVYTGEPIDLPETENTLRDNYDMYSSLFPKYKEWLDGQYLEYQNDLEERVRVIDSEVYRNRLIKFGGRNPILKDEIKRKLERYRNNKIRFESLSEFLDSFECETEEGRAAIDDISASVDSRQVVDEEKVEELIERDNITVDFRELKSLDYEELKVRADKIVDETDELEELIEVLKSVNDSNSKLIMEIEEKIKNIVKGKEHEDELINKSEREIEF